MFKTLLILPFHVCFLHSCSSLLASFSSLFQAPPKHKTYSACLAVYLGLEHTTLFLKVSTEISSKQVTQKKALQTWCFCYNPVSHGKRITIFNPEKLQENDNKLLKIWFKKNPPVPLPPLNAPLAFLSSLTPLVKFST